MLKPLDAADFEALIPMANTLRGLQRHYRPFSHGYCAFALVLAALDEAAERVTGEARFYGARCDTVGPVPAVGPAINLPGTECQK